MYQALYRKWRPRTFDDVISQPHITETLKNQVSSGRLSHAYLFVGTRGTGKTSCAKILARAVNCENPQNGNPCNKCKSCVGIEDGSILDVVELDAASNNGVDNVRALRDEAVFSPVSAKKRVYIIDEVHMLTGSAFNALLKILEEPPEHLMFILATTELHKVPATILSRCQRHSFKRISPKDMAELLKKVSEQENLQLDKEAAVLLSQLADGSMRDALSLLDQCAGSEHISVEWVLSAMGLVGNIRILELLKAVTKGDTKKTLELFDGMWRDGKAPATLLSEFCTLLRDILMVKVAPNGALELLSGGFDHNTLLKFAEGMQTGRIISDIDSIQARIGELRDGRDPKIAAELCLVGLCEPDLGDGIDRLRARVASLEGFIESGNFATLADNKDNIQFKVSEIDITDKSLSYQEPPFDISLEMPKIERNDVEEQCEPLQPALSPIGECEAEPLQNNEPEQEKKRQSLDFSESSSWDCIQEELKNSMPVYQYVHVAQAQGEIRDGALLVFVKSEFHKAGLEKPEAEELIRASVNKVLGETLPIKISVSMEDKATDTGKLDELSKFGNVKFE